MNSEVLLSIDCSNRWSCFGLAVDGRAAGEKNLDLGRAQAGALPLVAEELLAQASPKIQDVTCLAVAIGPGYFTGIRIGMAYAAGLAFALSAGVVPFSTLEGVLRSCPGWDRGLKVPLAAASRERVFSSAWRDGQPVLAEMERGREEVLAQAGALSPDFELWAVNDARLFANSSREGVHFIDCPSGGAEALLGWERRNLRVKPDELRAQYMREPGLGYP